MLKEILTARTRPSDKALYNIWARKISGGWTKTTITGGLPLTFRAKGGALTDYTVHGTAEGAGVQTENLFDFNAGYQYSGRTIGLTSSKLFVSVGEEIYLSKTSLLYTRLGYYNSEGTRITASSWVTEGYAAITIPTIQNYSYCIVEFRNPNGTNVTQAEAKTISEVVVSRSAPTSYIPYGYEIPLEVTSGQNTDTYPLYIGSAKLGAEEYLSYAEQKIYKDVSGTLTPTDPLLPFPAISAYQGENILSSTETVGSVSLTGKIKEVTP